MAERALLRAALLAAALLLLAVPGASAARRGHCLGHHGPVCTFWNARVTEVADGDTIRVRVDGSRREQTVRFTGINAMELTRYSFTPSKWRGECHAVTAARYVDAMVRRAHGRVRLVAQHASSRSGHRLRRVVQARVGGRWVDLGAHELAHGLALWLVNKRESAWDRRYGVLTQRAALRGRGLFDTSSCGAGPEEDAALRLWVKWDADGADGRNLNGEWARIRNDGARPVALGGWWFRDGAYRGYKAHGFTFPAGTVVPAHGEITLHVGSGQATADELYWGQTASVFENADHHHAGAGDGGYLFDPQGDLRAWSTYPCFVACGTPLDGRLRVDAHPDGTEYVDVTNVSPEPVALDGYQLTQDPFGYDFGAGEVLVPGATLRVYMDRGPSGARVRSWGLSAHELPDRRGTVEVRDYRDQVVACDSWGSARC